MINRFDKNLVIISLFTILFVMLFPKTVNAVTYTTRTGLYNAGAKAVNQEVRIYRNGTDAKDAFEQDHESSHIYCIQHNSTTIKKKYYDYTVKNYIKIRGNVATNSYGTSITNNQNLALAYILEKENWRKGYVGGSDPQEVRNLAIKHYMTVSGWMTNVGTKLGVSNKDISYFNINKADRGETKKNNVKKLIKNAVNYKNTTPSISADQSIINVDSMRKFGPIKFTFTGKLESIKLYNGKG